MSSTSSPAAMMTPESDTESYLSMSSTSQEYNYLAMIRQLLERFGKDELQRLIEEESSWRPQSAEYAQQYSSTGTGGSLPRSASLKHEAVGIYKSYSSKVSRGHSRTTSVPRTWRRSIERTAPAASLTQRPDYACCFCSEEAIRKTCTRRNDLRRHIENFHNSNALWFCQHPGCTMVFDWQTAYQSHLRTAHGRSHMNVDEARINLCPQTVFACGFENCTYVLEAPSEADTAGTIKEYSAHIVKHFEEGPNAGRWTYSNRIRNLLRQSRVSAFWDASCPETESQRLQWDPQSSMAARKILEAGHVESLPLLIQCIIMLGSHPIDFSKLDGKLEPPFKERCATARYGGLPQHNGHASSPQHDSESLNLEYVPYANMHSGKDVPRSVEPFHTEPVMGDAQAHGQYGDGVTPLHPLASTHLIYQPPGVPVYNESRTISSPILQTNRQPTAQYVAVGHEESQAASPLTYHMMSQVPNDSGAVNIIMGDGTTASVHNSRGRSWIGQYNQLDMNSSLSTGAYDLNHPLTPEPSRVVTGYGSPRPM